MARGDTLEEIDFAYSLGFVDPRRFLEFVQAMPKLRLASFQGIDEEEYDLGWSTYHPDWVAAQAIIHQRIPEDMGILSWGGVFPKSKASENTIFMTFE